MVRYVIRTSDRKHFKECRRAWDLSSKIRQDYEPTRVRIHLEFGTACHAAFEVFYDPDTWEWTKDDRRWVVEENAVQEFLNINAEQKKAHLQAMGVEADEELTEDFKTRAELGAGMLRNFFKWQLTHENFTPKYTEIEFEVPIMVPEGTRLPGDFVRADDELAEILNCTEGQLLKWDGTGLVPVYYQGRIDLIVEDENGDLWILDHKTAGRLEESTEWLELDEQCKSYAWALRHALGIKVRGVIYSEHYKGVPAPPKMNQNQRKGCWFSVSKSQDTAYETYLETVSQEDKTAYEAGLYDEILNFLKNEGKVYIRRTYVQYSTTELDNLGRQICDEAIDMLDNPRIYPNPTKFGCKWCDYRLPCLAMNDGSDTEWILTNQYQKRSESCVDVSLSESYSESEA